MGQVLILFKIKRNPIEELLAIQFHLNYCMTLCRRVKIKLSCEVVCTRKHGAVVLYLIYTIYRYSCVYRVSVSVTVPRTTERIQFFSYISPVYNWSKLSSVMAYAKEVFLRKYF